MDTLEIVELLGRGYTREQIDAIQQARAAQPETTTPPQDGGSATTPRRRRAS